MTTSAKTYKQVWLGAFLLRAGFTQGWENLETAARRMAEQAYQEIHEAYQRQAAAEDAVSRLQFPDTTGS